MAQQPVKTVLETRWGDCVADPDIDRMRAALAELSVPDADHPETWLEDAKGWGLVVSKSGRVVFLGPDSAEVGQRRHVSRDEALKLWLLLQQGRRDEIQRRLAGSVSLRYNLFPAVSVLFLCLLYARCAPYNSNDPIAQAITVAGLIIMVVGYARFLAAARQVNMGWFFACLFVFVWPFFCMAHFSRAWKPLAVWLGGLVLATIGLEVLLGP